MNTLALISARSLFSFTEQQPHNSFHSGPFIGAQVDAAINSGIPIPMPENTLAARQKCFLAMPDGYQPGAIISSSWGYDQTNIDFYRIEKRSGDWLTLIPLCSTTTEDCFMSGKIIPHDQPKDPYANHDVAWSNKESSWRKNNQEPRCPTFRKKLKHYKGKPSGLSISYGWASLWKGEPERCSWYA